MGVSLPMDYPVEFHWKRISQEFPHNQRWASNSSNKKYRNVRVCVCVFHLWMFVKTQRLRLSFKCVGISIGHTSAAHTCKASIQTTSIQISPGYVVVCRSVASNNSTFDTRFPTLDYSRLSRDHNVWNANKETDTRTSIRHTFRITN